MNLNRFALAANRLVTCDPARSTAADPLGVVHEGALIVEAGAISAVGHRQELLRRHPDVPVALDLPGVMTPGLVDAHTHAPWMGSRDAEYALRMTGADYEAIAKAGGGIVASMAAIRSATTDEIAQSLGHRLRRMASLGVTTVEAKSGYGLNEEAERRQLEAIASVASDVHLPRVVPTYLALHALPPEAAGNRATYIDTVAHRILPGIAADRLARFVDAYIDRNAFSVSEARIVFEQAARLGLGVRAHVGQFADVGGALIAAEFSAASADHLEHVEQPGLQALANAGVPAVLLPVASFTLQQAPPPIALLRNAGIALIVASDANPGTAPTESLPLALALAVRLYGLTVPEAILGATRIPARSLGLADVCGTLRPGLRADLILWDLPHENAIVQPWGTSRIAAVFRDGVRIAG